MTSPKPNPTDGEWIRLYTERKRNRHAKTCVALPVSAAVTAGMGSASISALNATPPRAMSPRCGIVDPSALILIVRTALMPSSDGGASLEESKRSVSLEFESAGLCRFQPRLQWFLHLRVGHCGSHTVVDGDWRQHPGGGCATSVVLSE